jgi:hypothetical protein
MEHLSAKYGEDPMGRFSTIRLFASPHSLATASFERAAGRVLPRMEGLLDRQLAERARKSSHPGFSAILTRQQKEWEALLRARVPGTRKNRECLVELLNKYVPHLPRLAPPPLNEAVPHHLALLLPLYESDPALLLASVRSMRSWAGKAHNENVSRGRPPEYERVRAACHVAEWLRVRPPNYLGELNDRGLLSEVDWKDVREILEAYGWDFNHLSAKDRGERTIEKDVLNHRRREPHAPCHYC